MSIFTRRAALFRGLLLQGYFPAEYNIDCFKAYRRALESCWHEFECERSKLNDLDLLNCDKVLKVKRRYLVRRIQVRLGPAMNVCYTQAQIFVALVIYNNNIHCCCCIALQSCSVYIVRHLASSGEMRSIAVLGLWEDVLLK